MITEGEEQILMKLSLKLPDYLRGFSVRSCILSNRLENQQFYWRGVGLVI